MSRRLELLLQELALLQKLALLQELAPLLLLLLLSNA